MTVRFIIGRSGSGKTQGCIDRIIEELDRDGDGQLILLVPEQASYQAEQVLVNSEKIEGYHRLEVLSFNRLAYLLTGRKKALKDLSAIGREMLFQKIIIDRRSELKLFNNNVNVRGLSSEFAQLCGEFLNHGWDIDSFEELESKLTDESELVKIKFADISLIIKDYLNTIKDEFHDTDHDLVAAKKRIGESELFRNSKVWIDGFSGFTGVEYQILAEIFKAADEVNIALCLDGETIDVKGHNFDKVKPESLFYPTEKSYAELLDVCKKSEVKVAEPIVLKDNFRHKDNPDLLQIERNLFSAKRDKAKCEGNFRIVGAGDIRAEVEFISKEICRLVRTGKMKYRDIAVVIPAIEEYEHLIRGYFSNYSIPFFLDRRKSLKQHSSAQFILSAIRVISENFSKNDIFCYLKNEFGPIEFHEQVEELENYCIAYGITRDSWLDDEDWSYVYREDKGLFDEKEVNGIRRKGISAIRNFYSNLKNETGGYREVTAEKFTKLFFEFLEEAEFNEKVSEKIGQLESENDIEGFEECRQVAAKLVDIFDEMNAVFTGEKIKANNFLSILEGAINSFTLAFIPPTLDQVLVGSIERSRHPNLKAVFLAGATQKNFPTPVKRTGFLNDRDRKVLEEKGFSVEPDSWDELSEKQYLSYIAFTRAKDLMYITYPCKDNDGKAQVVSQYVREVKDLFEDMDEHRYSSGCRSAENIINQNELINYLCSCLSNDRRFVDENSEKTAGELMEVLCDDKELNEICEKVEKSLHYENKASLSEKTVSRLYEDVLSLSSSRLSVYSVCPFKYFARNILNLKQRKVYELKPLDKGLFYHELLERFFGDVSKGRIDVDNINNEQIKSKLREIIKEKLESEDFITNYAKRNENNAFLIASCCEYLEECLCDLMEMTRHGTFRPVECEAGFGMSNNKLSSLVIEEDGKKKISIRGVIDRLDQGQLDNEQGFIVFDYKISGKDFKWDEFYHGLDMQLVIYLMAGQSDGKFGKPVGAFYVPIEDKPEKGEYSEISEEQAVKFGHKVKGILNGDYASFVDSSAANWSNYYNFAMTQKDRAFGYYGTSGSLKNDDLAKVINYCKSKIKEIAAGIRQGNISIVPYSKGTERACTNCEYMSFCRFDWQINDYRYLESLNKKTFLERVDEQ